MTHIKPGYYNPPGRPIFVLRWRGDYHPYDASAASAAKPGASLAANAGGQSARAGTVAVPNGCMEVVLALPLTHPEYRDTPLWLVVCRSKAMATVAYAFLLHLLAPRYEPLRLWLLRSFCHRTGWHLRLSSSSRSSACVLPSAGCGNAIHLALLP